MISKKMMSNLHVLSPRVLHEIFDILMALVLSHLIGICSKDKPKSLSVCFIQRICAQHNLAAIYAASAVDKVITT